MGGVVGQVASTLGVGDIIHRATGGTGNVLDELSGKNASNRALDAQNRATQGAMGEYQPFKDAGMIGLSGLQNKNMLGDFQGDPGYQFRLGEGMKAINSAAAARGLGNSGATMKALARYGQDYASNEYNNAYNREFTRMSTLAGYGQNAAQGMANARLGLGNSQASAQIGQHNNMTNLVGQGLGIAAAFSDERLKTDIKEISKEEIKEFRKHLRPYLFKYLSQEYGTGVWAGVMAQDLEKSKLGRTIVFENDKGEKQIDIKKAVSLLLALEAEG